MAAPAQARAIRAKMEDNELIDAINKMVDWMEDMETQFNAHTHNGDGAQAGAYYTSPPRSNTATVTAGTALVSPVTASYVTN